MTRITQRGEFQIRKGHKWVKPRGTSLTPEKEAKMKRWRDMHKNSDKNG